jgi:hypothetical protein
MKDIKLVRLDKYSKDDYKEIFDGIFLDRNADNYCFCFEADIVEQYPLEDLLDQYRVNCTEYYGQEVIINGEKKNLVEVQTLSSKKIDLIRILNLSTILGKEIVNVSYFNSGLLAVNYGNSDFTINGKEVIIPILAYRNDSSGMICFEAKYHEMQYKSMFSKGQSYCVEIENFDANRLKYILLRDGKARIIYDKIDDEKMIELIFGLKGFEQIN